MTAARRLAAYAAGYSRLKRADEAGTAKALERARLSPILECPGYVDSVEKPLNSPFVEKWLCRSVWLDWR